MHCCQVGCQPGRCEDGKPARGHTSAVAPLKSFLWDANVVRGTQGQLDTAPGNGEAASMHITYFATHIDDFIRE
jgi:hypothetical protein